MKKRLSLIFPKKQENKTRKKNQHYLLKNSQGQHKKLNNKLKKWKIRFYGK